MKNISNELLIHVYNSAIELKLNKDFIELLRIEISLRKLEL